MSVCVASSVFNFVFKRSCRKLAGVLTVYLRPLTRSGAWHGDVSLTPSLPQYSSVSLRRRKCQSVSQIALPKWVKDIYIYMYSILEMCPGKGFLTSLGFVDHNDVVACGYTRANKELKYHVTISPANYCLKIFKKGKA